MSKIEINGTTYEVGFEAEVGPNMAKAGAVSHVGLRGQKGGYFSAYIMNDGTVSALVSVGS